MAQLDTSLEKQLIAGVLTRIKANDPQLYDMVVADYRRKVPQVVSGMGGFGDIFSSIGSGLSQIGSTLGDAIKSGVSTYSTILANREQSKIKIAETNAAVKAQVAEMQANLELQRQQTNDAIIQNQLLQQQKALYNAGNSLQVGGMSGGTLAIIGVVVAGLLFVVLKPQTAGARR